MKRKVLLFLGLGMVLPLLSCGAKFAPISSGSGSSGSNPSNQAGNTSSASNPLNQAGNTSSSSNPSNQAGNTSSASSLCDALSSEDQKTCQSFIGEWEGEGGQYSGDALPNGEKAKLLIYPDGKITLQKYDAESGRNLLVKNGVSLGTEDATWEFHRADEYNTAIDPTKPTRCVTSPKSDINSGDTSGSDFFTLPGPIPTAKQSCFPSLTVKGTSKPYFIFKNEGGLLSIQAKQNNNLDPSSSMYTVNGKEPIIYQKVKDLP